MRHILVCTLLFAIQTPTLRRRRRKKSSWSVQYDTITKQNCVQFTGKAKLIVLNSQQCQSCQSHGVKCCRKVHGVPAGVTLRPKTCTLPGRQRGFCMILVLVCIGCALVCPYLAYSVLMSWLFPITGPCKQAEMHDCHLWRTFALSLKLAPPPFF